MAIVLLEEGRVDIPRAMVGLGVATNTARYHLRTLARHGIVRIEEPRGNTIVRPADANFLAAVIDAMHPGWRTDPAVRRGIWDRAAATIASHRRKA